ncbi:MAG: carboxypeptidase regulatory-like domain-containing protein [Thermoanaerobaculia bacterium]|nr:carboxypeptidase regulatory-like domain-containing protein [Thermoanaerobaculia bacterium]
MKTSSHSSIWPPLVFALLALSLPPTVVAEDALIQLELEIQAVGEPASPTPAILRATATEPSDPEKPATVLENEAQIPGRVTLQLPHEGAWRVSLESSQFWAAALDVTPEPGVAKLWRVRPTAVVRGRLRTAEAGGLPETIRLGFRSLAERPGQPVDVEGEVACPVGEGGALECRPPAGILDLALRAQGFVSHYLWASELAAGESRDLGSLELRRGASLVGWVETEDRSPIVSCKVRLEPFIPNGSDPELVARAGQLGVSASVNERGFFQLAGIEMGTYRLIVEQAGYATLTTLPVAIAEVLEKRFGEPLILHRPLNLDVAIVPATDARGRAWRLTLLESGKPEPVALGQSDAEGRWQKAGLATGAYQLMVNDGQGSRVAMEPIVLEAGKTEFLVQLPFFRVEGRVTLGGEPLAADLAFGGRSGAVSVAVESDAEGEFSAQLAREGEWDVDVAATEPKVFRRLRKVPVAREPGSGRAWVEIDLPDTLLEGEVVDEAGAAVPDATVLILVFPAVERPSTVRTDEKGHFELRGFEPGAFRLEARAKGKFGQRTSETVEVHVDKDEGRAEVKLVVRDLVEVRGRVVTSGGSGVPGASILAMPAVATGVPVLIPPQTTTDVAARSALVSRQGCLKLTSRSPLVVSCCSAASCRSSRARNGL